LTTSHSDEAEPMSYTASIRSVHDSDYLRRTLASLRAQTIKPSEIVISIPDDTDPWPLEGDNIRFVRTERGMVTQRAAGIREAHCRLILLLDDDIVLAADVAERLLRPLTRNRADCAVPYWPESWPKTGKVRNLSAFWGMAVPRPEGGISYTLGGGYYYPLNEPPEEGWETSGGAGAVIAVNRDFALAVDATGDKDFQRICAYALRDDGALILTWRLRGGKCLMLPGIRFQHLGGTSRLAPDRLAMAYQAQVFNHVIFWVKYVLPTCISRKARFKAFCALALYLAGVTFFAFATAITARSIQPLQGLLAGFVSCHELRADRR